MKKVFASVSYEGALETNLLSPVVSRALPNQRLVRAFCVDNGFTTGDTERSKAFRKLAHDKITNISDTKWMEMANNAKTPVELNLRGADGQANTRNVVIDELVQMMTLKLSLFVLFDMDPFKHDDKSIQELASSISENWQNSKTSVGGGGADWEAVREDLKAVFPTVSENTNDNPYNLVLPAYETMWRAVLFGFIEVAFKDIKKSEASGAIEKLRQYLANPTSEAFEHGETHKKGPISVSYIVNEVLRRYPPTKRIYRVFHMRGQSEPETVAANIEACHHDKNIWGKDTCVFRPERWADLTQTQRSAFMPFGGSPFVCPAKKDFGPRMIGILIAAFATQLCGQEWDLFTRDEESPCGDPYNHVTKETVLDTQRGWY